MLLFPLGQHAECIRADAWTVLISTCTFRNNLTLDVVCDELIKGHVDWDADVDLAVALAAVPQVETLNLSFTSAGDATLAALTYAHRAAVWQNLHGESPRRPDAKCKMVSLHKSCWSCIVHARLTHLCLHCSVNWAAGPPFLAHTR